MAGWPSSTGDGVKAPFSSNVMSLGSTWTSTAQCIHEELEHALMGFRHSGHCSAPRMMVPPFFWAALDDELDPVLLFLSLPHAAASKPMQNTRARSCTPRRWRLTKTDLLV